MGLGSRRISLLAGSAALLTVLVGCGGSVADTDVAAPTTTRPAGLSPFCAAAQDNAAALRPLNEASVRDTVPPDQLQGTVDAVRNSGVELLAAAPADIRPDVQTVVDALDAQLDALVRANGSLAAVAHDPAASATTSSGDAAAAARRVSAYINRTCR